MRKFLLSALLLSASMSMAQKGDPATYASTITAADLKKHLTIIAGPEMEGRNAASEGERKAAAYLESQYKRLGLKPGNGNSYLQNFPLFQDELVEKKLSVNGRVFEWDKDYSIAMQMVGSGSFNYNEVIFAGYGIVDSVTNDYANLNVTGKMVLILEGTPNSTTPANPRAVTPYSTFGKINTAVSKGATGVLIVSKSGFPRRTPTNTKGGMSLTKSNPSRVNVASISEEVASALLGRTNKIGVDEIKSLNKGTYKSELY